jgi:hypothetical protein
MKIKQGDKIYLVSEEFNVRDIEAEKQEIETELLKLDDESDKKLLKWAKENYKNSEDYKLVVDKKKRLAYLIGLLGE